MHPNKVKLVAGLNNYPQSTPFCPFPSPPTWWTNWPIRDVHISKLYWRQFPPCHNIHVYSITIVSMSSPCLSLKIKSMMILYEIRDPRDMRMVDKLMYIFNDDCLNYTFCRFKLVVETFGEQTWKTNLYQNCWAKK